MSSVPHNDSENDDNDQGSTPGPSESLLHSMSYHDTDSLAPTENISLRTNGDNNKHTYDFFIASYNFFNNETLNRKFNHFLEYLHLIFIKGPSQLSDPIYKCDHFNIFSKIDNFPKILFGNNEFWEKIVLFVYLIIWLSIIIPLFIKNLYNLPKVQTFNVDPKDFNLNNTDFVQLSCREYFDVWPGKDCSKCLNADCCLGNLRVFENPILNKRFKKKKTINSLKSSYSPYTVDDKDIIIKCPALCDSESKIYSTMTVGNETYKYIQFVVGGGLIEDPGERKLHKDQITYPYRADSFPCAAALHAGLIDIYSGGVARLSFISSNDESITSFPAKKSKPYSSVGFNSSFPFSFIFKSLKGKNDDDTNFQIKILNCFDYRITITVINVLFGIPLMYFFRGVYNYVVISLIGFWTIVLALDPPVTLNNFNLQVASYLISVGFRRLLPLGFVLYTLWKTTIANTLNDHASPLGKLLLWYSLYWVSMMNNLTFDKYSTIDRLIISDIKTQISSILTVLIVGLILVVCVLIQAFAVWKTGKLVKYLTFYGSIILSFVLLNKLPGLTLRIHHYIFGLMLIPGTYTRGFSALLFQGLLLGFIINGVARWDFASIVETDGSLRRNDPYFREDLRPPIFDGYYKDNSSISWSLIESSSHLHHLHDNMNILDQEYDTIDPNLLNGYSLLINDIERYRGVNSTIYLDSLKALNPDFERFMDNLPKDSISLYFRVAKASTNINERVGDYTNAGILSWPEGVWIDPKPGVT